MRRCGLLPMATVLVIALLSISGCDISNGIHLSSGNKLPYMPQGWGRWTATIVDEETGLPIPKATLTVWSYGTEPWKDNSLDEAAKRPVKGKWKDGMRFVSNAQGVVICGEVYTGSSYDYVRFSDANETLPADSDRYCVVPVQQGNNDKAEHHSQSYSGDFWPVAQDWHTVTSTIYTKGDWLAISVDAEGYQPNHFYFQPDSPTGDFGKIPMKKAPASK